MILLDTNVVSETMRRIPDRHVIEWLNRNESSSLFISTITVAEINYGLELIERGRRRTDLEGRFRRFISEGFDQRVVAFDLTAAHEYGKIMAGRRSLGRPLSSLDGQIGAICRALGFVLATRNVKVFEACGIEIISPFENE